MDPQSTLTHFGYTVVDDIGQGKFGKVKLATSEKHHVKVAIKIMERKRNPKSIINKFLTRELNILKSVKHPHIVQVHEIHEMQCGKIFIVMEAAEMDLTEKIRRDGRIPVNQAREWFSQLVSAVVYLHQHDIVHRDIKCKNVLLTADNQVKLTDFGLSRYSRGFPELTQTWCGTKVFMPPETLMGLSYDSKKFDVWSLGVLLYKMVIGYLPFSTSNLRELQQLQSKPVVYPWWWIRLGPCRDLISKMLQVNPHERLSMMEVAQHPWLVSGREKRGLRPRFKVLSRLFRGGKTSAPTPKSPATEAAASEAAAPAIPTPAAATASASMPEAATPASPAVPTPITVAAFTPEAATLAAPAAASTPEAVTPAAIAVPTLVTAAASTPEVAPPAVPAVPIPAAATAAASTPEVATPTAHAVPTPAAATPEAATPAAPAVPTPEAPAAPAAAGVEVVGEEFGCFASLRKRLRKIFRLKSTSSPPASSTKVAVPTPITAAAFTHEAATPAAPAAASTPEAVTPAAPAVPTLVTAAASTPEVATPAAPAVPTPTAATAAAFTPDVATPAAPAVPTPAAATAAASTPEVATPAAPAVPTPAAATAAASTPEVATPAAPAVPTPAAATAAASTPEAATPAGPAVPAPEAPTPAAPEAPAAPTPEAPAAPATAGVEVVGEEFGCFTSIRKRLRKIFRSKSTSSPPASSTEVEQRRVNRSPQPTVRQVYRRLTLCTPLARLRALQCTV